MKAEFGTGAEPRSVIIDDELTENIPLSNLRDEIGLLYNEPDLPVDELKSRGVEVVKQARQKTPGIGCFYFIFGKGSPPKQIENLINKGEVCPRQAETVALYLQNHKVVHSGWVEENGETLISKWGFYDVCRHSPENVPLSFGEKIIYIKPQEELKTEIKTNMEQVLRII